MSNTEVDENLKKKNEEYEEVEEDGSEYETDDEEGEEDEEEGKDEEEDDEEEEEEPQLKYQRIVGSLPKIFEKENGTNYASALAVSDKFLVFFFKNFKFLKGTWNTCWSFVFIGF
jgi:vacuolar protein sorting-associated protein 41